ncbi:alpha-L-fucosidase [Coraliomargarita sp. SDUM461003]|uniref:alpha-L-fucosidase n=1 Tax=Thalassobacterium maritimum TaxID=3041265 RepID=A0ABU1ARZ0_9BACT|nr:alpha-L-fucosidase [Coraliomargarita sp. SDUM461003]MDQ8206387.1 alpha-L-fucosidase [Coraliomargarita sp. SDUM461003]
MSFITSKITWRKTITTARPIAWNQHSGTLKRSLHSTALCLLMMTSSAIAERVTAEKPDAWWSTADPKAMSDWKDMRFGMFIHWGPVAISGERISWSRGDPTPVEEYDNLYKKFDAVNFDPEAWVATAQAAGMKYIVLTTKHHDGFCLWDSEFTEYDVMNTPLKRDVVKELAEACHKAGMPFGTYYSVCDWHNPDFPRTGVGGSVMREESNYPAYKEYLTNQVTELVENYGPLLSMWYDVPQGVSVADGWENIRTVRELQPNILVNDRSGGHKGLGLGDYSTPERHVGDFDNVRPWESCVPLGRSWSWKPNEILKPLEECIQSLVSTAGGDGNLLLNIGPTPDGIIEPEQVERLEAMGDWLEKYGETIYETRGGPFKTTRHVATTHKGNMVYVHILNWPDETLFLPKLPANIVSHRLLTGGNARLEATADGYIISIPEADRSSVDTILALELDRSAAEITPIPVAEVNRPVTEKMPAVASEVRNIRGNVARYAAKNAFDGDLHKRWAVEVPTKEAWLEVDMGEARTFDRAVILEFGRNIQKFEIQIRQGEQWKTIHQGTTIGKEHEIHFEPQTAQFMRFNVLESTGSPSINEFQLYAPKKSRK